MLAPLHLVFVYPPGASIRSLAHICTTDLERAAWFAMVMLERGCEVDFVTV